MVNEVLVSEREKYEVLVSERKKGEVPVNERKPREKERGTGKRRWGKGIF